jgi:endonuclease/exonuclease/phosphatase family metal-dependent hydrolase
LAYAAHFAPSPAQAAQAEALAGLVRGREKVVLMGDLNSRPESDTVTTLASVLRHADSKLSAPTFTMYPHEYQDHKSADLTDRVDYIFTSSDITVMDAGVGMSRGSNHLPIWAILEV